MNEMAGTFDGDSGTGEVAPVSFLIARGMYAENPSVPGPHGTRLAVGDCWQYELADTAMTVIVEPRADGIKLFLSLRMDRLTDREWAAFAAMPNCLTLLATPPIALFLIEYHGGHSRAAYPLNTGAPSDQALQAMRSRPFSFADEVVLFGIAGDTIRCVKVGIALDRVWETLSEAAAATPSGVELREYRRVLERFMPVDAGLMFAEAMALHLTPR